VLAALALVPGGPSRAAPPEAEASAEESLWSHLKGIQAGPFRLDVGAGLRLRGELQENLDVRRYGTGARDLLLLERVRLEFGASLNDGPQLFVQWQDAHELGCDLTAKDFPGGSPYDNHFDLRQAFLAWPRIGGTPLGVKLGRQAIAFADNRLMGPGEWGNVGRYTWDAAVLTWRSAPVDVDAFYARRVRHDPAAFDRHHFDEDVLGLYSTLPAGSFRLHLFYFLRMSSAQAEGAPATGLSHRHAPGISLEGEPGPGLDVALGLIPQLGRWASRDVFAWGAYLVLGYTAQLPWRPRVGLHYAYGSGDAAPADDTTRTFDGLFGAVDVYYGRMNLCAWMNLHDAQLALSAKPSGVLRLSLDYHLLLLAEERDAWYATSGRAQRHDPTGSAGRLVGQELDLLVAVKATQHAELQAGYALFVPGEFVRETGDAGLAHWGFLQANYAF